MIRLHPFRYVVKDWRSAAGIAEEAIAGRLSPLVYAVKLLVICVEDCEFFDSGLEKSQRDDSNSALDIFPSTGDVIPNNALQVTCSLTGSF